MQKKVGNLGLIGFYLPCFICTVFAVALLFECGVQIVDALMSLLDLC